MSKSRAANHIHRYKKVDIGRDKEFLVYKCIKPSCSHYVPCKMAEGLMCECYYCGNTMIITNAVLKHSSNKPMARPRCLQCIKRKKGNKPNAAEAIAAYLSGNKP